MVIVQDGKKMSGRLERFRQAQDHPHAGFESALHEIQAGRKRGHWIWYVFPQLAGLGVSSHSTLYGIEGVEEATEYLRDHLLRSRLLAISTAVAEQLRRSVPLQTLMGSSIDAHKLVSSLTLFGAVAKKLYDADGTDEYGSLARVADEVLAAAASAGHERCTYTLAAV